MRVFYAWSVKVEAKKAAFQLSDFSLEENQSYLRDAKGSQNLFLFFFWRAYICFLELPIFCSHAASLFSSQILEVLMKTYLEYFRLNFVKSGFDACGVHPHRIVLDTFVFLGCFSWFFKFNFNFSLEFQLVINRKLWRLMMV